VGLLLEAAAVPSEPVATPGASASAPSRADDRRRADAVRRLVGIFDRMLRRLQGVHEFSVRSGCLLRIALHRTTGMTRLPDGTRLAPGTDIIDLHLWNEQLAALPGPQYGLGRGAALRAQMAGSLSELARHLETDPALRTAAAIRAQTALVPRRRIPQLLRLAAAFGFRAAACARSGRRYRPVPGFCRNVFIWVLAWTFNPSALRRNGLQRQPCELWISRDALIAAHGGDAATRRRARRACIETNGSALFSEFGAPAGSANHRAVAGAFSSPRGQRH